MWLLLSLAMMCRSRVALRRRPEGRAPPRCPPRLAPPHHGKEASRHRLQMCARGRAVGAGCRCRGQPRRGDGHVRLLPGDIFRCVNQLREHDGVAPATPPRWSAWRWRLFGRSGRHRCSRTGSRSVPQRRQAAKAGRRVNANRSSACVVGGVEQDPFRANLHSSSSAR